VLTADYQPQLCVHGRPARADRLLLASGLHRGAYQPCRIAVMVYGRL